MASRRGGVRWTVAPLILMVGVNKYYKDVKKAAAEIGVETGKEMQGEARAFAPWHDVTGNARNGLFYAVDGFGVSVEGDTKPGDPKEWGKNLELSERISGDDENMFIALSHSMYYGQILEIGRGGRYSIILQTLERYYPKLEMALQGIF